MLHTARPTYPSALPRSPKEEKGRLRGTHLGDLEEPRADAPALADAVKQRGRRPVGQLHRPRGVLSHLLPRRHPTTQPVAKKTNERIRGKKTRDLLIERRHELPSFPGPGSACCVPWGFRREIDARLIV